MRYGENFVSDIYVYAW